MKRKLLALIVFVVAGMICIPLAAFAELPAEAIIQNAKSMWQPIRETQPHVTAVEFQKIRESDEKIVLIDVRTKDEYEAAHLPGAINIERGCLEFKAPAIVDPEAKIYVYCRSGARGALACDTLQKIGYKNVTNIYDGFKGWVVAGFPVYDTSGEYIMCPEGFEKKDPHCVD